MTVNDYMRLPYRMNIDEDPDEGGYVVSFPDLPGCLTCVETLDEVSTMAEDAKRCWFEAAIECGCDIPMPKDYTKPSFPLNLPHSLKKRLSRKAEKEGVSLADYCLYVLSSK